LGSIVVTQSQLFPRAAEKVLAMRAAFAQRPLTLTKLLRALDAAAAWADDPANHPALASYLARPKYLDLPEEIIAAALAGRLNVGTRAEIHDPDFLYFHRHAANVPSATDGLWAYAQMVRWGQLAASASAERAAARVFASDSYRAGVAVASAVSSFPPPFDGVEFPGADVGTYLEQFEVHTPFADARSL
jgi:NitT/TauT family transport system ATP-binding protein